MNFTSGLLKVHRAIVGRLGNVILGSDAEVAELADAPALGAGGRKAVGVRVPSSAPTIPPQGARHVEKDPRSTAEDHLWIDNSSIPSIIVILRRTVCTSLRPRTFAS